jgi:lipid II:glycine glycyltransferase (peptidoglycan interpeptide bridge formation enzyme)
MEKNKRGVQYFRQRNSLYYTVMVAVARSRPTPVLVHDPSHWDSLVLRQPAASFLQSSAWGRFKQHFGWAPVWLCLPGFSDVCPPVAQVLFKRIPRTPFTMGYVPRGPLLCFGDAGALAAMADALDRLARRYRALALLWELGSPAGEVAIDDLWQLGLRPAAPIQTPATRIIDLRPDPAAIQAQQKPKWRSNTRLAIKHGVQVRAAESDDDFRRWYALHQETGVRDGFVVRDAAYYRRFWSDQRRSGDTVLLLAEHEGALVAGIMVHRFGPEATYLYGAFSYEGRSLMPNHLLQWEAMLWAKQRGAVRYDLFGIAATDDPSEPLAGVTRFKAGFGGYEVRYAGAFERVYRPVLYELAQRARRGRAD